MSRPTYRQANAEEHAQAAGPAGVDHGSTCRQVRGTRRLTGVVAMGDGGRGPPLDLRDRPDGRLAREIACSATLRRSWRTS